MTGLVDALPFLVEQIRVTIAELRTAWAWLDELVEPGRDSAPAPLLTDEQLARLDAIAAAERAERAPDAGGLPPGARQFVAGGAYALPATRAGARIGVIDARAAVHGLVLDAVRVAAGDVDAVYVGDRPGDAGVLDALWWLDGGQAAWVVDRAGRVVRRPPCGVLDQVRDTRAAALVDARLQRALRVAQAAARDDADTTAAVDGRCPACGRRSLQLDYRTQESLADGVHAERARRGWLVQCVSEACRCGGEGCGCRQAVRYPGRRHAWAYGDLPGLWRAMAAADRRRRGPETRVGSETAGHGGWAERRTPKRVGLAVRDRDGVLWWDRERACHQLAAKPENLRDWVRRSAREPGWPRLDSPRRNGQTWWWVAEQLLDVDEHLSRATRGRRRQA